MNLTERLIQWLKDDPEFKIESRYGKRDLVGILGHRSVQALRGIKAKVLLGDCPGIAFIGRRVVVEHGFHMRAGPGLILEDGVFISALAKCGIRFGRNVTVGRGAQIVCTGVIARQGVGLEIGDYSAIGALSFIGAQGGIRIGSNVIMGPCVRIFSENHNFESLESPIRQQGESRSEVFIEDDCWIGTGATILAGVRVGTGSVVAAGSVVTRSIPPYSVVGGVPARVLRTRYAKSSHAMEPGCDTTMIVAGG